MLNKRDVIRVITVVIIGQTMNHNERVIKPFNIGMKKKKYYRLLVPNRLFECLIVATH